MDTDKLTAAKLWLISEPPGGAPTIRTPAGARRLPRAERKGEPRNLPYLAQALFALIPVPAPAVTRMTCDESWRLYVNPGWLTRASVPEVAGELAHLVWHLLHEHAARARDLSVDASTADQWSAAADVTVAGVLAADELVPRHLWGAGELDLPPDLSAEQYYAMISGLPVVDPDQRGGEGPGDGLDPTAGCGSGCDGVRRSHELPPDADTHGVAPEEARAIRRSVAVEYTEHATLRGDSPGDAWRWAAGILKPQIPWESLLARSVRRAVGWTAGRGDYTYSRPSRRASSVPGIVLPGQRRLVPRVAIVVDTSASVDDVLLGAALGEVDGALKALGVAGESVRVYSCDVAVPVVSTVRRVRDVELAGGGGTDLRVGLRAVEQQRPRPDVVVVLTDGDTPWPAEPPPGSAVVIGLLGRHGYRLPPTPAWATRVECLI